MTIEEFFEALDAIEKSKYNLFFQEKCEDVQ
jgi:hypothetical protein